jgi:hypothetical protein
MIEFKEVAVVLRKISGHVLDHGFDIESLIAADGFGVRVL